jgi:hypothetical protein
MQIFQKEKLKKQSKAVAMSNITVQEKNMRAVESALVRNDISQLTTEEKMSYYNNICKSVGLNPLTKPFSFLKLQGREVLYATKDCTEQLRKIHGVSTQIISKGIAADLYEVHVKARDRSGKEDEDLAYVVIKGLSGADLANAMLKCVTKAKRRVTLSICGLGVLDESELDTVDNVSMAENPQIQSPFKKEEPKEEFDDDQVIKSEDYVIQFGKKYKDKKISEVSRDDHKNMIEWLEKEQAEGKYKIQSADEYLFHAKNYMNESVDDIEINDSEIK